ncbi:MAG: glycosyltransferase, partial [Lachnospiraceae bacterium]|nr:glycosyltransferase [Lachnospiraceae bacterium]
MEIEGESIMISVIIPVYNVKPYIERCLDSVINQSYKDLDIIVVDDGSNDGSESICEEYQKKDSRISVLHQQNSGLSVARNSGLDIARGEWVTFLDSDDWIEPSMYQTLLELSTTYNADISSCATLRIIDGKPEERQFDGAVREFNFNQMIEGLISGEYVRFEVWNKLWRRSLIGDLRFKKGQISEDVYFDFQAFSKANMLVHINRPLHNYVVNRPGSTNTSFKIARLCIFDEFDSFISRLKEEGNNEVCDMMACIALIFSKNLYEEAVRTEQDKAIKERLYQLFKKYYKVSG